MSVTISDHQARVYEFARAKAGQWLTVQEISVSTNVPENTVKSHAARFEEIGIFERIRISPAHAFRLDADADKHAHKMVARLNEAVQIFSARRLEWLKREESIVRQLDGGTPTSDLRVELKEPAPTPHQTIGGPPGPTLPPQPSVSVEIDLAEPAFAAAAAPPGSDLPIATAVDQRELVPATNGNDFKSGSIGGRGSKVDLLLAMVAREEGASLDELVAALGNQSHSIRASISVESRKRGLKIECVNSRYYLRPAA
jgi:hypothetical protein